MGREEKKEKYTMRSKNSSFQLTGYAKGAFHRKIKHCLHKKYVISLTTILPKVSGKHGGSERGNDNSVRVSNKTCWWVFKRSPFQKRKGTGRRRKMWAESGTAKNVGAAFATI